MPPQKRWNRFSIIAAVLFILAWTGTNFFNHLVWLATSKPVYLSSQEAGISGLFELVGVILPYIIVTILSIIALRKIRISGEKGKILSWIVLILGVLSILLWVATIFGRNSSVRELFAGDPYSQSAGNGSNEEAARTVGRDTIKYGDMSMIRSFLAEFHQTYGRYPLDSAEIKSKGMSLPRKDWNVTYESLNNGGSYVIRVQLEIDSMGRLTKTDDKDGTQGSLNCDDNERYLCYTP
jgi:hypothetical protein